MTRTQQAWAAQHDWFLRSEGSGVWVQDCGPVGDEEGPQFFDNIKKLRDWAGY